MTGSERLTIYLPREPLARVRAGTHNFFLRLSRAVEERGWQVQFEESTLEARLAAPLDDGHALYLMEEPTHPRALTCRRCYIGGFWAIEASPRRWEWPVARADFHPAEVDRTAAVTFLHAWKKRLYPGGIDVRDDGFVFIPLQGRLTERRSFQAASPIDMIRETLARIDRPVIATLHPNEAYGPDDLAALDRLSAAHARFSVHKGGSDEALARCHVVVTENSSMALKGYFLEKPAILFAGIDFHHIAASVPRDGIEAAFQPRPAPDFARYLHWFFREHTIAAGGPDCGAQILATLRRHGWPI
ncbi:MAG: hypothetical protein KDE00_11860 [Rhodobacteraceae bacterium]|nr:hypothetical protein [Paracoccaceae bacterium]